MKQLKSSLETHPFLRGLGRSHLEFLGQGARLVEFKADQVVLREGQTAYELYLIQSGAVALEAHLSRETNLLVQRLGAGDVLGWSWLFPPYQSHFQARALEPTRAIFLDGARLLVACEENHDLGYELMKRIAQVLMQRLQAMRRRLAELYRVGNVSTSEEPEGTGALPLPPHCP